MSTDHTDPAVLPIATAIAVVVLVYLLSWWLS